MKVSLIMPVRNEEGFIKQTLESVFNQVRKPDEIIIGDGCSTDRTVELIKLFCGKGIQIRILKEKKLFVGSGRNVAINNARYDVISAVDFGTILDAHYLEEIVKPFEEDHTVDMVAGTARPHVENLFENCVASVIHPTHYSIDRLTPIRIPKKFPKLIIAGGTTAAFKKEAWKKAGGFPEWIRTSEDKLFSRKIHRMGGKVVGTLKAVVYYHVRDNLRSLFKQQYSYGKGNAQSNQISTNSCKLLGKYLLGLVFFFFGFLNPLFWYLLGLSGAAKLYRSGFKPFFAINKGIPSLKVLILIPIILLTRDVASVLGHIVGYYEWFTNPLYRRKYFEYMNL